MAACSITSRPTTDPLQHLRPLIESEAPPLSSTHGRWARARSDNRTLSHQFISKFRARRALFRFCSLHYLIPFRSYSFVTCIPYFPFTCHTCLSHSWLSQALCVLETPAPWPPLHTAPLTRCGRCQGTHPCSLQRLCSCCSPSLNTVLAHHPPQVCLPPSHSRFAAPAAPHSTPGVCAQAEELSPPGTPVMCGAWARPTRKRQCTRS